MILQKVTPHAVTSCDQGSLVCRTLQCSVCVFRSHQQAAVPVHRGKPVKGTPIILVPPGETATITMWNAKVIHFWTWQGICALREQTTQAILHSSINSTDLCFYAPRSEPQAMLQLHAAQHWVAACLLLVLICRSILLVVPSCVHVLLHIVIVVPAVLSSAASCQWRPCRSFWNKGSTRQWRQAGRRLELQAKAKPPRTGYIAPLGGSGPSDMRSLTGRRQTKLLGTGWWRSSASARHGSSRPTPKPCSQ